MLFFLQNPVAGGKEEEMGRRQTKRLHRIPRPERNHPVVGDPREIGRHNTDPCKLAWKMCEKRIPLSKSITRTRFSSSESLSFFSFLWKRNVFLLKRGCARTEPSVAVGRKNNISFGCCLYLFSSTPADSERREKNVQPMLKGIRKRFFSTYIVSRFWGNQARFGPLVLTGRGLKETIDPSEVFDPFLSLHDFLSSPSYTCTVSLSLPLFGW